MREYRHCLPTIIKVVLLMDMVRNGTAGTFNRTLSSVLRGTKSKLVSRASSNDVTLTESDVNDLSQLDKFSQMSDKELATFSERDLLGELSNICRFVGGLLPGDAECTCGLDLTSGIRIAYQCAYQSPLCLFRFCSVPSIDGFFTVGRIDVSTEFCFLETEWRGRELPGICITLSGEVVKDSNPTTVSVTTGFGNNNPTSNNTNANARTPAQNDLHSVLAENRKRKKSLVNSLSESSVSAASVSDESGSSGSSGSSSSSRNKIISCSAQTDDDNGSTRCNSCEICRSGRGIKFDCSNIYPGYVQSQCHNYPIFGRYTDLSVAKSQFLPILD